MTWDAEGYDRRFSFVTTFGEALLELLDPQPGERVLDLGCGTGHLTAQIAERGATVEGVDADPEMLGKATAEHPDLPFRLADARTFTVTGPVDAVLSNATLHWVQEPHQQSVLDHVHAALRPGGRFVAEMGGAGNVGTIVAALQQARLAVGLPPFTSPPWCFPSPAEQAARLERAGFRVRSIELFDRPTPLSPGDTTADWLRMFGEHLVADVPLAQRPDLDAELDRLAAPKLQDAHGSWHADYVRLRWYATA